MVRSFVILLYSISLVFSILAPSVLNLLDLEYTKVIMMESTTDESQTNGELSLEEDAQTIQPLSTTPGFYFVERQKGINFHLEDGSIHLASIHLPPPEFFG